jgi:UrcA family protein
MRTVLVLPLILLGACTTGASARPLEPAAHVVFGDLALGEPAGRAELRLRVATAAREFCRRHEDAVTPQVLRNDNFFCLEQVRSTLVADMPADVRRAYKQALREAGIRGRRL